MYLWQGGLDGQTQECGGLDSCRFSSGCHSGLCHSLASCSVDWALLPLSTSKDYKASNKVRKRSHCKTSWSWDWNLLVACRCIACLRNSSDTHHGGTDGLTYSTHCHPCCSTRSGGDLVSCILSMQDITLRRTTDPHVLPWGSRI